MTAPAETLRRPHAALLRSLTLALALSLALLAPGVAVAVGIVGIVGGGAAPVADEMFPSGVQASQNDSASASRAARTTAIRPAAAPSHDAQPVDTPSSLVRSSVSARHGPPPLRGPPIFALF